MNPLESQLDYPFGDQLPAPAARIEVAPGVFWIRMPLPFALDHINLWLLRDCFDGRDGWTVVDCGISDKVIRGLWERVIADQLDGLPVVRVICTHTHPDHVGLAAMLTERFSAPLWMTLGEYAFGRVLSRDDARRQRRFGGRALPPPRDGGVLRRGGPQPQPGVFREPGAVDAAVPSPASSTGEEVRIGGRDWRVIIGLGHSPEHASFYCEEDRLLIAGDMVLPRISTNVSVWDIEPLSNPVQWFLDSLRKFEPCAEDTLVLPSHGRPFRKLHVRLRQLDDHHQERLSMLLSACGERSITRRAGGAADVQPKLRHPPDDLRPRRSARAPACALVCRRSQPVGGRGRRGAFRGSAGGLKRLKPPPEPPLRKPLSNLLGTRLPLGTRL